MSQHQEAYICGEDSCQRTTTTSSSTSTTNSVNNESSSVLNVEIISDIACPFCFLGKLQLEKALEQLNIKPIGSDSSSDLKYTIYWKPFLLNPNVPAGGMSRDQFFKMKFGMNLSEDMKNDPKLLLKSMPMLNHIENSGLELGIKTMNVANMKVPISNTLNGHRLIRYVEQLYPHQTSDMQNKVADRVFRAYFEEGRDVSQVSVMNDIVKDLKLQDQISETFFLEDVHSVSAYTDEQLKAVKEEAKKTQRVTSGVPYFTFTHAGKKTSTSGAIGIQSFVKLLKAFISK
ncbi:predicted protein [Naegleria gruberi]|uniref:Predicted protein n=1 Tax=Naegleria gruberi TaxID=5762 RepID=D2V526_NAEGR|nr:uncharacterized protein NAEGRDRAFT_63991 [Naegleria gruberi]EFC48033.1 predicted protein [Naegleria gruberi]|eukprot:XP_002680777.1 predicted protein [Naegleria gruberi strain NEG-M]